MPIIPFVEDIDQQASYLISLADAEGLPHSVIKHSSLNGGFSVPQPIADAYEPTAVAGFTSGSGLKVVHAGEDMDFPRPDVSRVYWNFAAGVDPGAAGENITNGRPGDLVFVASA